MLVMSRPITSSKLLLVVMLMIGLSVFEGAGMQTAGPGQQVKATQAGTQLATGSVLLLLAGLLVLLPAGPALAAWVMTSGAYSKVIGAGVALFVASWFLIYFPVRRHAAMLRRADAAPGHGDV